MIKLLETTDAGVAELADAQDLKSCGPKRSYRFDSGLRHHNDAGWSSPEARRAHNPKVVGSNPSPATIDKKPSSTILEGFLLYSRYHYKKCVIKFSHIFHNFKL